jgi:hypothetical protein
MLPTSAPAGRAATATARPGAAAGAVLAAYARRAARPAQWDVE